MTQWVALVWLGGFYVGAFVTAVVAVVWVTRSRRVVTV